VATAGNVTVSVANFGTYTVTPATPVTVAVYKDAALTPLTFTVTQVGGANGTANSTGIVLTFNQAITGLTAGDITITNGSGAAVKGTLSGGGTTWMITLASVAAQGDITVSVGNFGAFIVTTAPQPVTVYKDARETYTVTYNPNGGLNAPPNQTKVEGVTLQLASGRPFRPGYIFLGWSEFSWSDTPQYDPGDDYTNDANITLYAVWEERSDGGGEIKLVTGNTRLTYRSSTRLTFNMPVTFSVEGDGVTWHQAGDYSVVVKSCRRFLCKPCSATVYVYDAENPDYYEIVNIRIRPSFAQYLIIVFLFGWLWY